ncbi:MULTISPECIES: hypothetical protein [Protofrankia]|uniref:Uncharacterized protein n=1 Tax=Candidatus Protofrankia datiscae TaxID=2716812 RepID=F8B4V0_9ACTN|nr:MULTISPECIES: hypothetical protein [Protofrankia]AEH10073.1 hypothetical protein FsymDg_2729 [Candidatus Protofrankia datiscae]
MARPPRPPASIRQRPFRGLLLKAAGFVACCLGMASGVVGERGLRPAGGIRVGPAHTAVALALMAVLLGFGRWSYRQGGRHRTPLLEPLTSIPEDEPIVLFLRAFDEDRGFAHIQSGDPRFGPWTADVSTEEEQLTRATAPFGRMVALGRPSDSLPPVGAARDYAGDDEWKGRVLAGLARARLVLLAASPGGAVRWETERVIERKLADRLVVLVTGDGRRYESFRGSLSHLFPRGLPEYRPVKQGNLIAESAYLRAVVWFDADWTAHLVQLDDSRDGRSMLTEFDRWVETAVPLAIWPLYQRAALPVPGLPSGPCDRPRAVAVAVTLITVDILVLAVLLIILALRSSVWLGAVVGAVALLLLLSVYGVWRGGYMTVKMVRFYSLLFGAVTLVLVPVGLSLLTAGLLLRRRSVRDWTASRVLFPERPRNPRS